MRMEEFKTSAREVINDPKLSCHLRRHYMASLVEAAVDYPELTDDHLYRSLAPVIMNGPWKASTLCRRGPIARKRTRPTHVVAAASSSKAISANRPRSVRPGRCELLHRRIHFPYLVQILRDRKLERCHQNLAGFHRQGICGRELTRNFS